MNDDQKSLIKEWSYRCNKSQIGHYITSERYSKLHYLIGLILILLTTVVTSSLFLNASNDIVKLFIIITSISASVLATIQTFITPSEKAEIHRSKAGKYGALKRKLEQYMITNNGANFNSFTTTVRAEWDSIAENSPTTPKGIRDKIKNVITKEMQEIEDTKL